MFYCSLLGIVDGSKGISRAKAEIMRNPDFVAILDDLKRQIGADDVSKSSSLIGHPKLTKLKDIVLAHFQGWDAQLEGEKNALKESRVMIFSQFRDSVEDISHMLSKHKPLVRVMSFIGQQSKGNTSKGLTQKEQLEVFVEIFFIQRSSYFI